MKITFGKRAPRTGGVISCARPNGSTETIPVENTLHYNNTCYTGYS